MDSRSMTHLIVESLSDSKGNVRKLTAPRGSRTELAAVTTMTKVDSKTK